MASRYKVARAAGKERFNEVLKEDAELLDQFGFELLSIDGGLSFTKKTSVDKKGKINPWDVTHINLQAWEHFVRPLLRDLQARRVKDQSGGRK